MGNKAGNVDSIFVFKMSALENTVLDSAMELIVTSESNYNWIILIYRVTRYTYVCNIHIYKFQAKVLKYYVSFLHISDIVKKSLQPF